MIVAGFCIGNLVGFSGSPVINIVISTIMSAITGLLILKNYDLRRKKTETQSNDQQDAPGEKKEEMITRRFIYLGCLLLGLLAGAYIGIFIRTNDFIGLKPGIIEARWNDGNGKIDNIHERLFNAVYGNPDSVAGGNTIKKPISHILPELLNGNYNEDYCAQLNSLIRYNDVDGLLSQLKLCKDTNIARIAENCTVSDSVILFSISRYICNE